jgi:CheY-like chemotaxis protein
MWGTEAIRRIREREAAGGLPPVPIVFESAAEALIDEALSDGADAATGLPLDAPWLVACFRWALGAPASSLLAERFRDHPESLVPAFVMAADRLEGRVPRRGVMRWFHAPSPALDGAWPADRVGDPAAFAAALEAEAALHS